MTTANTISHNKHTRLWKALLLLAVATLLVYAVSFFNGFVLDDEIIIVNNPQTLSLRNVPDVLLAPDVVKPYYRPLNRATYLFDYQVAGLNPAWYHGVNIVIHLGNVLLLYLVCRRFLPDRNTALIVALLFAVHPANTEAVNFISARNTLLALFFSLASLLAFVNAREKQLRWPLLSAMLFFCALLSKETGFMLIAVIALYCLIPLPEEKDEQRSWPVRLSPLAPFLFVTLVYFVMRSYSLQGIMGTTTPADENLVSRLAHNYYIIPQYIGLLLFPTDLTLFHNVPKGGLLTYPWYFATWLALLAIIALMVRSRNRTALFGLAWFVINYAPIANIVPIPSEIITERYLYLPAVGFFIAFGSLLSWLCSRGGNKQLFWGGLTVVVVACAASTVHRNLDWKNALSLFSSGARNNPGSPAAHYNLGTAFREVGDLVSARKEWEKTLTLDPNYADALAQMGTLSAIQGDMNKAEEYYIASLKAPPGVTDRDKAMAHYNLGKIYEKWSQPQRALLHYQEFIAKVPITYLEYKPDAEQRIARLRSVLSDIATK
ncbi:MAG: tetratricopeptide repeat protein [Desulfuromonadales bacterium]